MAAIEITIGETARLALVLADGDVAQYPRVKIYQPAVASPVATLNLGHVVEGMYETSWLPPATGTYHAVYTVYQDSGHTVLSDRYSKELDQLIVRDDLEQQILTLVTRIEAEVELLSLQDENSYIDNPVYDDCCQVLSSRIRVFDTKAHCEAATDGGSETLGLLATYQVVVDYEGPAKMKTYRKVRL
jgi:hypothetical protein